MSWEDERAETAATRFEHQLRSYEREKFACRLKVCCLLQLVRATPQRHPVLPCL